jgi:hypothetical protein
MKKIVILLLAVVLSACGTPAVTPPPTEQAVVPTPVVVTVVVEPTQAPATPVPAEPVVVTVVVEPTQAAVVAAVVAPPTEAPATDPNAPIPLDNVLGKGVFTNMTMSSSNLTLRCTPRDITFNITTPNSAIKDVVFYYRIMDLGRLYSKEYKAFGKMIANGNGNFTLNFKGENVHPDLRIDGSWLDFQFVGLAKSGDVVDRSKTIESLVKYTFDCP